MITWNTKGRRTRSRLEFCASAGLSENLTAVRAATRLWHRPCSALARDLSPDAGHSERIGVVDGFDRETTGRFDEDQVADHPFAVVGDEGTRHHDRYPETRGVGEKRLVRIVVGEPCRQRAVTVEGVNGTA